MFGTDALGRQIGSCAYRAFADEAIGDPLKWRAALLWWSASVPVPNIDLAE